MSKKDNIPLGVQQEFEDVDYWHKLSKTKMVKGTNLSEYEWMKKFMHEAYANNFNRKDNSKNFLKTEEQQKWARRNNNNTNRDALNVINKSGKFATLMQISEEEVQNGPNNWKKYFSQNNYDRAAEELMRETLEELDLTYDIRHAKILLRFNYRLKTLVSYIRADIKAQQKKCKKCGKRKWKTEFRRDKRTKDGHESVCKSCRGRKDEQ